MPDKKAKYEVVTRDTAGKDETITVSGTSAEQTDQGQLKIYDGDEQVFGGISIVRFRKLED